MIPSTPITEKIKEIIEVKDEDYKNMKFEDSQESILMNIENVIDPNIKERIIKLFKRDYEKQLKHKAKEFKKMLKLTKHIKI